MTESTMPQLRNALTPAEIQQIQKNATIKLVCFFAVLVLAFAWIGFIFFSPTIVFQNPPANKVLSVIASLLTSISVAVLAFSLIVFKTNTIKDWATATGPLDAYGREHLYARYFSDNREEYERYRLQVIEMGRQFDRADLDVLQADAIAMHRWTEEMKRHDQAEAINNALYNKRKKTEFGTNGRSDSADLRTDH